MWNKSLIGLALAFAATSLPAQESDPSMPIIRIEPPECLPNRDFAPITVQLDSDESVSTVRLYFRRLNPVGSFYYLEMTRVGNAVYSALFPAPADRAQPELDEAWWSGMISRDWLEGRDRGWLEDWLSKQDHEAAEYFIAVTDVYGDRVAQSVTRLIEVLEPEDCQIDLTPREKEWTDEIAIGATMDAQEDLPRFHWN